LGFVVICACGRVGFDAPASLDGPSSDADNIDAKPLDCEDLPGILFCDGFEGGSKLAGFEATPPSSVEADAARAFRGSTSLHARTTRAVEPAWYIGTVLPALSSGEVHARWYLYYPSSNPSQTFASIHVIDAAGPNTGVVMGATNGMIDVVATENNELHVSAVAMPLDRWFCVQLRFTIATVGIVETWIDGAPAARLDGVDTQPIGGLSNVHAGLFTAANGGINEMWTDELAIGTQPIGCL
jgi:hypothetical protein